MNTFDPITLANRRAKGKRPQFLDDPAVERVLSIAVAVATELAVLRERVDTIERLLEKNGSLVRADIENFRDPQAHVERSQWQKEYVARIFRMLQQDREALEDADESSMEAIAAELAADDGTAQA